MARGRPFARGRIRGAQRLLMDHRGGLRAPGRGLGRGCFERGLTLIAGAVPRSTAQTRVLVTERELPGDHQRAYLAGATRVVVMGRAEGGHLALLQDLSIERRR